MFNLVFVAPPLTFVLWHFCGWKELLCAWQHDMTLTATLFRISLVEHVVSSFPALLIAIGWHIHYFFVHLMVVDVCFYLTHSLLHEKRWYAQVHKVHHRFTAPTSCASMYAHWFEFAIGNLLGVILGPCISGAPADAVYFWVCVALLNTGGRHSGYYFLGAQFHDLHHEKFLWNEGLFFLVLSRYKKVPNLVYYVVSGRGASAKNPGRRV